MRSTAYAGQDLRPVRERPSPSGTPPYRVSDIRLSTRIALRGSPGQSVEDLRELDSPNLLPPIQSQRRPSPLSDAEHGYSGKSSSDSSLRPRTAKPTTGGSVSKGYSGNSFKKTLRRVFSLGSPERVPETAIKIPSAVEMIRGIPKASTQTQPSSVMGQSEMREKFQRPVANPQSPRISNDAPTPVVDDSSQITGSNASRKMPIYASRNRLRRTKSRILRVNTATTPEHSPSATSFYSPTTPVSIPYLPSSQVLRQLRPTHSPLHNALPPNSELPLSQDAALRSRRHSRRDSMEVQRSRYDISRGGAMDVTDIPGSGRNSRHRRRPSFSSINTEVGSLKSPKDISSAVAVSYTAPRQKMEVAGMIARLDDLETRMAEVEHSLRRVKDSYNRETGFGASEYQENLAMEPESQLFHTPPSSRHGTGRNEASFLRESSSTPLSNQPTAPSSPLDERLGALQSETQIAEHRESPYTTSRRVHSSNFNLATDTAILRESLLKEGYDRTMQHVMQAVNSEHNARIALEANVKSLKHAMSALRIEIGTTRPPTTLLSPDQEEARNFDSSATPTDISRRGYSDGEDADAILPSDETRQSPGNMPPRPTSVAREPLEYTALWSYAAVPVSSPRLPTVPSNQSSGDDQSWADPRHPKSKFSSDDMTSDGGVSDNEQEEEQRIPISKPGLDVMRGSREER